jgi:hypothetical protein
MLADGDTAAARQTISEATASVSPAELGFDFTPFSLVRILPETYGELVQQATNTMSTVADTTAFRMGLAELYHQIRRDEEAERIWTEELTVLEAKANPLFQLDFDLYRALICASLGRGREAIRITDGVLESSPVSADAFLGTVRIEMAALIYIRAGAHDQALDQLEILLSIPSQTSRALLRLDPAWDPLRVDPRFKKLVGERF